MFWNKKPKSPITQEDQVWVEESLNFLRKSLGQETLLTVKTVTPTRAFFDRDLDSSEADAQFILKCCTDLMNIDNNKIKLAFYSEGNNYLDDGSLLSTDTDIYGKSKGTAGTYQKQGDITLISIERGQLKHPESLIATICHELAHEKLLGENRIIQNDEYLTDLTAIAFGFGIFIANAKFQFESGKSNGFGWEMKSQGYLPEQISAYAMASLALKKGEKKHDYATYLDSSVASYFEQGLTYLKFEESATDVSTFWPIAKTNLAKETLKRTKEKKPVEERNFSEDELKKLRLELPIACLRVELTEVERILKQGISPNAIFINGSPLAIAVLRNSADLVELLLMYGADVNYSEPENMMDQLPLMIACKEQNITMIKYLLDLGAEINKVGGNGKSVLEFAVETGNTEVVNYLLESGGLLEIKSGRSFSSFDKTPIIAAVVKNDTAMVSFLVEKGAKTKPIRKITRNEIHPKMVKFLKSRKYL